MKEKFIRGVLGGIVAGVFKDIPDVIFHDVLRVTNITFWDYAAQIALKRHPVGISEKVYSFFYELIFSILIAIIYIYLIPYLKTKHYLFQGAVYGAIVWLAIHTAILAFHIEALMFVDFATSIVNSVNSVIYGIILAYVVHYLEKRQENIRCV